ncbi:MAG: DNA-directed RNA polymerase subunit alpha [Candidatus Omnitrophica bacterium]|nr:DNA-directed RNA polymerase subunit alpha [Candidatus Omnitrophota bacterium]
MEQFKYPTKIDWEKDTYRETYGKAVVEPLERGFAITVGNCLRRVLLSAIPGVAITSVKIDGIAHEFSAIPGVKEDVTDVVLNLKQVNLKANITDLPKKFSVMIEKKTELLAGDLFSDAEISVENPKLHIATLSEGAALKLELTVSQGFGYVPVGRIVEEGAPITTIPLAASFSPITRVSYRIENTRVGQRVDYERLLLEIWTTGAITPKDAVKHATEILNKHFNLIAGEEVAEARKPEESPVKASLPEKTSVKKILPKKTKKKPRTNATPTKKKG